MSNHNISTCICLWCTNSRKYNNFTQTGLELKPATLTPIEAQYVGGPIPGTSIEFTNVKINNVDYIPKPTAETIEEIKDRVARQYNGYSWLEQLETSPAEEIDILVNEVIEEMLKIKSL